MYTYFTLLTYLHRELWCAACDVLVQLTNVAEMRDNVEALEKVSAALEEARLECEAVNREEELFEWSLTQFPQLEAMMQAKDPYEKLWNTAYHFSVVSEQWLYGIVTYNITYSFNGILDRTQDGCLLYSR